jgi:hypothetical protein
MQKFRNSYKSLVVIPVGKRPLRRAAHGWEDNIKMNLKEIKRENVEWILMIQDMGQWLPLANTVM